MYSTICAEWAVDHFGLDLTLIHFDDEQKENDFHIFVQSNLNLGPLKLKFALLVTRVQWYNNVSTKL